MGRAYTGGWIIYGRRLRRASLATFTGNLPHIRLPKLHDIRVNDAVAFIANDEVQQLIELGRLGRLGFGLVFFAVLVFLDSIVAAKFFGHFRHCGIKHAIAFVAKDEMEQVLDSALTEVAKKLGSDN